MAKPTPEEARLAKMLAGVPLFSGLDGEALRDIAEMGKETTWKPGQTIIKQGERGLSFLLVLEGSVKVQKKGKTIATAKAGGFFGEMTVLDDKPRSADIVAAEETRCFGVPSWSFYPMLRSNLSIAIGIIEELVARLRRLDESPND
ncbi:MAG TPA: cyclic nucleotide-binding domain-containing protein [Nitrososphaerales archaeon]|nr:cyclic nucleotide-binding domain-containing protein [Nitrososphaerales archaeon]